MKYFVRSFPSTGSRRVVVSTILVKHLRAVQPVAAATGFSCRDIVMSHGSPASI